jgi:Undecaprenyl-phosphate galactose phosphotransferase WbaP
MTPSASAAAPQRLTTPAPPSAAPEPADHHELTLALAPWAHWGRQQKRVRAQLIATDLSVFFLCFLAARLPLWVREDVSTLAAFGAWWSQVNLLNLGIFAAIVVAMVGWMGSVQGHYTTERRKPWWDEARQVVTVIVIAALADAALIYLGKWQFSRLWTGTTWLLILGALPLARFAVRNRLLKAGHLAQPYVLIGRPNDIEQAAAALASERFLGYTPVAVVCPEAGEPVMQLGAQALTPIALSPGVRELLAQPSRYQVVAVFGNDNNHWLRELTQELMLVRDDVIIIPALNGLPLLGMEVSHFFSHEVLLLRARNNLARRGPQLAKRVLDLVGASVLLLLLAPLFAWVAWRIKREGGGPVFFTQDRVGKNGELFKFIKFRSMVLDADGVLERWKTENEKLYVQYLASNFKLASDPRITQIGTFIRQTSIDELPQLINVLRGEMSLVGPRPLLPRELGRYGPSIVNYNKACPGITGLWQINGRSASTFQHRIAMDLWYVRNWSVWYDFVILLRTFSVVFRREGAC